MHEKAFTLRGVFTQAGFATTLGYMMYVAWDSMERDRYLAAYQGAGEIPILWSPVFLTVALLCALVAFLAHKDIIKTLYKEPLCWLVPLISAGSSVTLCLQRLAQQTPNPVLIATFALCIAWFVLVWAEQFGTLGGMKTLAILLVADALSALFQILCVKTMGSMALLTTTALMPIVSFLLLRQAPHPTSRDLDELGHQPVWSRTLLIGIGAFGMMYFMLRSMLYVHPYSFVSSIIVPIGSLVSLSLLAVLAWCLRAKRGFIELVIYAMLGAAMLLFLLAIILTSFVEATPAWSVLVIMSNRCGFIAFMVALAEVCVRQRVRPLTLFSIGFASLYAGYAIGGFIGVELARYNGNTSGLLLGCSILALFCIGVGVMWLFRAERNQAHQDPSDNAIWHTLSWLVSSEGGEKSDGEDAAPDNDTSGTSGAANTQAFDELYEQAVAQLANKFALSPREAEVLLLLARGRSSTYISSTLYISPNTTKKHIQHIYKKLNTHSNQDVIDLVEQQCRTLAGRA